MVCIGRKSMRAGGPVGVAAIGSRKHGGEADSRDAQGQQRKTFWRGVRCSKWLVLKVGRPLSEASGNVSLSSVRDVAETGVDFISVGALTHSAPSADMSLRVLDS